MKQLYIPFFLFLSFTNIFASSTIKLEDSTIISTTGFEEKLLTENKNIVIIDKDNIEKKEYKNLESLLKEVPYIIIQNTYFGPVIDLRGNGDKAISRVKTLVDGISINPIDESMGTLPLNSVALISIDKIEIIPGGGSVLNGSGSGGGIINIVTNLTSKKDFFNSQIGFMSFNTRKAAFSLGKNINESLYFNSNYTYLNGAGYRNDETQEANIFNIGFIYKMDEQQNLKINIGKFKDNKDFSSPTLKKDLAIDRKKAGFPIESKSHRENFSLDYELNLNENLTILTTFYIQNNNRNFTESSIADYSINKTELIHFDILGPNLSNEIKGDFKEKSRGYKIRGKYLYDSGELILGYDYNYTDLYRFSSIKTSGYFYPIINGNTIENMRVKGDIFIDIKNDVYKETNGFYTFNRYKCTESLDFIAGIRYEHSKFGGDRYNYNHISFIKNSETRKINSEDTSDNIAIEVGTNYQYSETGAFYSRYERGFLSPLPGQITDKIDGLYYLNSLKSEKSDTFEVGIRDLIQNSYLNWTIFSTLTYDEITIEQKNIHNPAIKGWRYLNLDKTRRVGTEFSLEQYFSNIRLWESFSYIDTEITKGKYKRNKIPLVPKSKLTLGLSYEINENMETAIIFNYIGKSSIREFDKYENNFITNISSYNFTDISFNYKISDSFTLNFGIENIFNHKYNYSETKDSAIVAPERTFYFSGNIKL
ncbi:TonB-dependent receptor [uncultured Cetobacterium sp.]|uniref:TonB-dependent receptor n=1 Tax=uncultured Cetobacterium sp. TaxID=527638 RepID=UPI00261BA177|nr:TonB-dependent receptor [uncultured Cetobacterium sp.]